HVGDVRRASWEIKDWQDYNTGCAGLQWWQADPTFPAVREPAKYVLQQTTRTETVLLCYSVGWRALLGSGGVVLFAKNHSSPSTRIAEPFTWNLRPKDLDNSLATARPFCTGCERFIVIVPRLKFIEPLQTTPDSPHERRTESTSRMY
ncbi:hypothetical protein PZC41_14320, partial [Staphylococcus aureus]|uniref:hypothetical protein n=1 Tax=Staphylococcus aureus TaxID=1280 RepID=UPI0023B206A0